MLFVLGILQTLQRNLPLVWGRGSCDGDRRGPDGVRLFEYLPMCIPQILGMDFGIDTGRHGVGVSQ
jgi:hypothetical protein